MSPERSGTSRSKRSEAARLRTRSPRTRTTTSPKPESPLDWLREHYLLVALLIALTIALLAELPWLSRSVRIFLVAGDMIALMTLLASSGPYRDDLRTAARRGPNPLLLALLAWCILSAALSPNRAFADPELFRLFLCAAVYFAAAYGLSVREAPLAAYGVLLLGGGVAMYGAVEFGSGPTAGESGIRSIFGNHEQLGSFLTLLLPVALAFALDREGEPRVLMGAQAIALFLAGALLLARTRSAWAGGGVSLLMLSFLALRYAPPRLNQANKALIIGPLVVVLLGFMVFMGMSEIAPLISTRAATLSHVVEDSSFADRLHRWRAACRMASERPVTGWGLGMFPLIQGRWTHQGDDTIGVLAHGTSHSNLAHNFWVQWAAETGAPGLALYVGVIAAFFGVGLGALREMPPSPRRTLLMGCLAATAGGVVDAAGAPSYTFPGVSSLAWLWIGLGVAACRATGGAGSAKARLGAVNGSDAVHDYDAVKAGRAEEEGFAPALPPTPLGVWAGSIGTGAVAALIVLGIGWTLRSEGQTVPRGSLSVSTIPPGPVSAGTLVLWAATYRAPDGTPRPTLPGTIWTVTEGHLDAKGLTYIYVTNQRNGSGWLGKIPPDVGRVTVTAHYWDNFSRPYVASRMVLIRPALKSQHDHKT